MNLKSVLFGLISGCLSLAYASTLTYHNSFEEFCLATSTAFILYLVAEVYLRLTKRFEYFGLATVGVLLIFVWEGLKITVISNLVLAFLVPYAILAGLLFNDNLTGFFIGFMMIFPFIMCL